jgi:peptide/nickel transport system substrate-binding protein
VGSTEFGVKPIGSGPFKLKEWVPGDHITLEAFDEHPFRKPILREVTIRQIPDNSARLAGLRTGTLDIINGVPLDQSDQLKADGFDLAVLTAGSTLGYVMDTVMNDQPTTAPTIDKRVRQAINYAVDKDAIAKQIYKGLTVPSGQPLQAATFGYNPNVKPYDYDPAKAKALLAEAGYSNGLKLTLETHVATPEAQPVALLIQQNLKDVGIDLNVQLLTDLAVWRDKLYDPTKQRAPLFFSSFSNSPAMDADLSLTWFWSKNPTRNYNDPEFDRLYEASRTEMDPAKRLDLLQQATARLHEEAPYLWIVESPVVVAFAPKKIKGVVANVEQNEQRLDKLQKIG